MRKNLAALDEPEEGVWVGPWRNPLLIGGCNGCTRRHAGVREIHMRSVVVRLCRDCGRSLLKQWKESPDA